MLLPHVCKHRGACMLSPLCPQQIVS